MNKKRILSLVCALTLVLFCSALGVLAYAENEGGAEESDYTVCFVHEDTQYPMVKNGDKYEYQSESLSEKTLYRIEIKDKNDVTVASALLYKNGGGTVEVIYEDNKIKIAGDSGDIYDNEFDFDSKPYYVSVDGGKIKNEISGLFAGRELSSFYFAEDESVSVEATHDHDQGVAEWVNNIGEDYGKQTQITVVATGAEKNIKLRAKLDYLPLEKLLSKSTSVTLKKNYEITDTVKLDGDKSYTVNMNGFNISGTKEIFEIDGSFLIIEGQGKIESTIDQNGAIYLKSGALTLNGQTVIGNNGAVMVAGGELTVNGGSFDGKSNYGAILFTKNSDATATINDGSFNELLNSEIALSVQGGEVRINGGSFYGSNAISAYGENANIKIIAGLFFSDNFESKIKDFIDEGSTFTGDSTQGYTVTLKDPTYTITINDGVLSNGYSTWEYEAGVSVTVKPVENTDGMVFERWEILDGDISVYDLTSKEITFVMPEGSVVIRAIFVPDTTVDTGTIDTGTTQPPDTAGTDAGGSESGNGTGAVGSINNTDKSGGSMAIIVLIILLIALLIAAIVVSIILIVRNYRIEREAAERAALGASVVDSLADSLAGFDFGDSATAAGVAAAKEEETEDEPLPERSEGIDFDREINLNLTNTLVGFDGIEDEEPKNEAEGLKLRRPRRTAQRPSRNPRGKLDE